MEHLLEHVQTFAENDHNSLGITCKTRKQADSVHGYLRGEPGVRPIDAESKTFSGGVIISTAYLAKGLEFDEIIVPFCNEREYSSAIDRHMLYVAVTRAMHALTITHSGELSTKAICGSFNMTSYRSHASLIDAASSGNAFGLVASLKKLV